MLIQFLEDGVRYSYYKQMYI